MLLRIIFSLFFAAIIGYVIFSAVKVEDIGKIFFDFPKQLLILLLGLSFLISVLKSYRFLILLRNSDVTISYLATLKAFVASQAVTPLPGGEAMRGILINKHTKAGHEKTTGPVLMQAFLEIFTAGILTLIGSLYFEILLIPSLVALGVLLFISMFIVDIEFEEKITNFFKKIGILESLKNLIFRITKIFGNLGFKKWKKILLLRTNYFYNKASIVRRNLNRSITADSGFGVDPAIKNALSLSIFIHILGGLLVYLIAYNYNADLNFFESVFIYSSTILIQGLSAISPGGVGFTEGGMAGILLLLKVEAPAILAIVVIFRLSTLIFNILTGVFFLTIFYGKDFLIRKANR